MSEPAVLERPDAQDTIQAKQLDEKAILRVRNLNVGYGKISILHDVHLDVREGEIVCIIGPNGAGKSTAFKAIYGFLKPNSGQIYFDKSDITAMQPDEILKLGITYVPQGRTTFAQMTVSENLELGMYSVRDKNRIARAKERIYEMFPRLGERQQQLAGTMIGGEQRMLEIGRSLMLEPRMIMLDEPSAGLAPVISKQVFSTILRLNHDYGITVFMVEQNARQGLEISHRGYVLEGGRNRFEGTGQDLINSTAVQRLYLGGH